VSQWSRRACVVAVVANLLGGCATTAGVPQGAANPRDPWEAWNRKVFAFNEALDENLLRPVATAYRDVVPQFVRTGVTNVFNNFADAWGAINSLLQGKGEAAASDTVRFAFNSVFGIAGVLDLASEARIDASREDFGQTLGYWGFGPGPYVVWPVLGPSAVRESAALPFDLSASPTVAVRPLTVRWGVGVINIVNTRANLLGATRVIEDIALDKYSFIRDAYLARRRSLVYDGEPPELPPDEEPADTAPPEPAPAPGKGASAPSR
jgi:phospholipid-binding lipoprotein MlaA